MKSPFNARTALLGGVLASFGASVCCVGPLLLLSLGIGGAWIGHLTAFEPYRPLFITLVFLFIGLAFWKLYLVPQPCNGQNECDVNRVRQPQRVIFWIATALSLSLIASPWWIPLVIR